MADRDQPRTAANGREQRRLGQNMGRTLYGAHLPPLSATERNQNHSWPPP